MLEIKNSEMAESIAEVIREHGWVKNKMGSTVDGFCLLGAAERTLALHGFSSQLLGMHWPTPTVEKVVNSLLPGIGYDPEVFWASGAGVVTGYDLIGLFNDAPFRTKEEVLEAADKSAKYWRDKGE